MSPRAVPDPVPQCLFGYAVLLLGWFVTAATAFAITASVLRRKWQLSRGDTR